MELILQREPYEKTHTYGALYLDGVKLCDTIERPWLYNKKRVSCIPPGTYPCFARKSLKNGDVWQLDGTEPREAIQVHSANFAEQLEGCIAVGSKGVLLGKPAVLNSKLAMYRLKQKLPEKFTLIIRSANG